MSGGDTTIKLDAIDHQNQLICKLEYMLMAHGEYLNDLGEYAGDLGKELAGFHFMATDLINEFKANAKALQSRIEISK